MSSAFIQSVARQLTPSEITGFRRDGFLSVSDLTTPEDITYIQKLINPLFDSSGQPCGVIDHLLKLLPALRQTHTFRSCQRVAQQLAGVTTRVSFDQALYKPSHERHGTPWHQDQAFRNPFLPMNTVHFWIPLQPVTVDNGCLHFIPGSHHRLLEHFQVSKSDRYAITTRDFDATQAVACPLSVGSATIHLPLTLHAALPNNTDNIRRAWSLLFRPWGRYGAFNPLPIIRQFVTTT